MKKGFTIIEVTILFVIFLIVAFLVAPLSVDDTIQAKNTSRWRSVQDDFTNIINTIYLQTDENNVTFKKRFETVIDEEFNSYAKPYNINYLNGNDAKNIVDNYRTTQQKATFSYKIFDTPENKLLGIILYDVNGTKKPNTLGKDIFGYNVYEDRFKPFCRKDNINKQKKDCSRNGTGLCCSNYYLIGGNFD